MRDAAPTNRPSPSPPPSSTPPTRAPVPSLRASCKSMSAEEAPATALSGASAGGAYVSASKSASRCSSTCGRGPSPWAWPSSRLTWPCVSWSAVGLAITGSRTQPLRSNALCVLLFSPLLSSRLLCSLLFTPPAQPFSIFSHSARPKARLFATAVWQVKPTHSSPRDLHLRQRCAKRSEEGAIVKRAATGKLSHLAYVRITWGRAWANQLTRLPDPNHLRERWKLVHNCSKQLLETAKGGAQQSVPRLTIFF